MSDTTTTLRQLMDAIFVILKKRIDIPPITIENIYWNGGQLYYTMHDHNTYPVLESELVLAERFFNNLTQLTNDEKENLLFTLEECILKRI